MDCGNSYTTLWIYEKPLNCTVHQSYLEKAVNFLSVTRAFYNNLIRCNFSWLDLLMIVERASLYHKFKKSKLTFTATSTVLNQFWACIQVRPRSYLITYNYISLELTILRILKTITGHQIYYKECYFYRSYAFPNERRCVSSLWPRRWAMPLRYEREQWGQCGYQSAGWRCTRSAYVTGRLILLKL